MLRCQIYVCTAYSFRVRAATTLAHLILTWLFGTMERCRAEDHTFFRTVSPFSHARFRPLPHALHRYRSIRDLGLLGQAIS